MSESTRWDYNIKVKLFGKDFENAHGAILESHAKDLVRHYRRPDTVGEIVSIEKTAPNRRDREVSPAELLGEEDDTNE